MGAGLRLTKGNTPDAQPTEPRADKLTRKDLDLTADWLPTGFSTVHARASMTRETHTQATASDVSGTTGSIEWVYKPTGKLGFSTSIGRDTGSETTFSNPTGVGASPRRVDDNRLTTTAQLALQYELTAKIAVAGSARQSRGSGNGVTGDSRLNIYTLNANYAPTRNVTLGCNYARESRSETGASAYSTDMVGCTAQLTLR